MKTSKRIAAGDLSIETSGEKLDPRLTPREAADYLHVSLSTFQKYPIRKFKRGRIVRYDKADLDAFYALNTVGPKQLKRAS